MTASKSIASAIVTPRWLRSLDNRLGERMLRPFLEACRQRQEFVFGETGRRDNIRQLWPTLGQCAGLVHDQRIDGGEPLQSLGVLDQYARLRAAPGSGHDRHRSGQAQRAGAGDDQDGNRRDDGVDH